MSHEAATLPAQPALRSLAISEPRLSATVADLEPPPLWTATRIDVARRLWSKGAAEADIIAALNRYAGAPHTNAQALIALARRLCWPHPQQRLPAFRLTTRDGLPSMAERQALELAFFSDVVDMPMADALAWGRANGVVRGCGEPVAMLLARVNVARAQWGLPRFRITRMLPADEVPEAAPPAAEPRKRRRRRRAA